MRLLEIKIKNWAKHNPRANQKKHSWFKFSNDFFNDPDFYRASLEARQLWIFILCSVSKSANDSIKLNTQMAADNLNVRLESIDFAIEELLAIGCVEMANISNIHLGGLQSKSHALEEEKEEDKKNIEEDKEKDFASKKILPPTSPQEIRKTDFCRQVITILNSICGSHYPVSDQYCVLIEARKHDGYTLEDFRDVIAFRQRTWANDPKMRQWLRPETLFGTKFYSYLEESKKPVLNQNTAGLHSAFKQNPRITKGNPTGDPYLNDDGSYKEGA